MFKLESYITPLILSYVDKYIKNFRAEDSQVSLWGGDASFHNLDLRLDVLEQELQLPFSLISGHIHELLIHVPWTKLASEPIKITINTIECSLTLRDAENDNVDSANSSNSKENKRKQSSHSKKNETIPPPGYVQSLINKIVSNITIFCNNLILKYVEEDIVISVNIKMLALQSANENWRAAYIDISPEMVIRKLINLSDLTVCLDKRNAAGKIEIYQEPILYRCGIEMRFLRQFLTNSDKTLTTRLDIYCNRMEFSMTEQQIPMMMRIVNLLLALYQRQLKNENISDIGSTYTLEDEEACGQKESWAGWAWSVAANIFPSDDENTMDWTYAQQQSNSGNTFQFGVYIDNAIFTFKVSEFYSNDKGYYPARKLKYWPVICLQLNGCYTDTVVGGKEWTSVQMGISEILILPQGICSCGINDITDSMNIQPYFKTGSFSENFKSESLFDPNEVFINSTRKNFMVSWDYHVSTVTESVLLEKTAAFAIDFLYHLEIPDDFASEKLSELGSDLEFSNLVEKSICRIISGPFTAHISSGLIHRLSTLYEVMNSYDYSPYKEQPPDPELSELLPPSTDDFEALSASIPLRFYQITFLKPVFVFHLMDHPKFVPSKENLTRKMKKPYANCTTSIVSLRCPNMTIECETVDSKIITPMYPKRLIYTTCQLPDPPEAMLDASYSYIDVKITGLNSQMIFNLHKKVTIVLPFNISCLYKTILFPKYWIDPEMVHEEITAEIDSITITSTKAKLIVAHHIIEKLIMLDIGDSKWTVFSSTLLQDSGKDSGMIVLELCGEQLKWKRIQTNCTEAHNFTINSLKAFVIEPVNSSTKTYNQTIIQEPNQVLLISAPECSETESKRKKDEENILLNIVIQFPRNLETFSQHPTILFFHLKEIKVCVDLLFFQWLFYNPKYFNTRFDAVKNQPDTVIYKSRVVSEVANSLQDTPRRTNTPHESIHGSSERENNIHLSSPKPQISIEQKDTIAGENSYCDFMLKWYEFCSNMVIFGSIAECTLYFPNQSLSAIGAQGIEEAIKFSLEQDPKLIIVVIKLPHLTVHTAGQRQFYKSEKLPINLPSSVWTAEKNSFPWGIEIKNICCYTLQKQKKLYFVRPASGNITIGMSLKYKTHCEPETKTDSSTVQVCYDKKLTKHKIMSDIENKSTITFNKDNLSSFSICVYVDNTPIEIALSEAQVYLISSILNALVEVIDKFNPKPFIGDKFKCKEEFASNIFQKVQNQSPTLFKEEMMESLSEKTPTSPHIEIKNLKEDPSGIKCTVWMQWTITKFKIILYSSYIEEHSNTNLPDLMSPNLKFVFDMEDIMTSLDLQEIYTKFKLKIVTASMHHYRRKTVKDNWEPGIYFGTIMRNREELPTNEKQDDFGFMSITVTKAVCGHVHNKWGASKKHKLAEMKIEQSDSSISETRYISEIIATFQPVDFIISPKIIKNFYMIVRPLFEINQTSYQKQLPTVDSKALNYMACVNNNNLPLAYLDCKGLRIVFLSSELIEKNKIHDIAIIEIESINLLPTAENPICRNPIRPDIYQQAAQSRILNIPGSEIEDRQYQFNINSLSVNTGSWKEFSQMLCRESGTALHTMNENPALEWNNLEWGRMSLIPNLNLLPIIKKFNQCIIIAPAITCGANSVLICGCSLEINCISDIEIDITIKQIRLLCMLAFEFCVPEHRIVENSSEHSRFSYIGNIYANLQSELIENEEEQYLDNAKDSGVELIDNNSETVSKIRDTYSQSTNIEGEKRSFMRYNSESRSSDFSQCLKCASLIPSAPYKQNYCPLEVLITGGNITISIYQLTNQKMIDRRNVYFTSKDNFSLSRDETTYEASEKDFVYNVASSEQKVLPLLFIQIAQPNIYIQDIAFEQKTNLSFFDIYIKANDNQNCFIDKLPSRKDYNLFVMETKTGICDPVTGIPPSFLTLKWKKGIRKSPVLDIVFGRPIKFNYSPEIFTHVIYIKKHILHNIHDATIKLISELSFSIKSEIQNQDQSKFLTQTSEDYMKYKVIKALFSDNGNIELKISQIVLSFKTKSNYEMMFCLEKIESNLSFFVRPERIVNNIKFKNVTIMSNYDGSSYLLLNPWCGAIKSFLFWESWQTYDSDPQIQITVDMDCLHVDLGPQQIKCIESVIEECNNLVAGFTITSPELIDNSFVLSTNTERDQYYKDDLRAGAFQFVDSVGTENELPLPYQVIFWNQTLIAMAWRYPQPRILTKVRVFPVPFKLNSFESENQQVLCFLEYWCDCLSSYKTYTQFYLSESEVRQLELPTNTPQSAVASTWRVVLSFSNSRLSTGHCISPRALAACMRIDSYFNPILIPQIQLALNLFSFKLSIYNQFNKNLPLKMPEKLRNYTPDGLIPDNQCFLIFHTENTNMYIASWSPNLSTVDVKTSIRSCILDYSSLLMKPFIQQVTTQILLDLAESVNISVISEPITITFSPSVGHSLAVSLQLWAQNWQTLENMESPDMVIVTRYIICNDTNIKLRFGQFRTDEDILLPSRFLHLYCWRSQKSERKIILGIESNSWIWSKPLKIDKVKSELIEIGSDKIYKIQMTVKNLSSTQKQIIFSGQLVVCNMLLDHFEMKVIPLTSENKNLEIKNAESYILSGKTTAPSLIINMNQKMALRLRFLTLESAWSGDVPLEENTKCSQPWLVKIPLQERGQFLSIWCRIVNEKSATSRKLLVMLWPLFTIRSNLPVVTKVQVETPVLNIRLETTVKGQGELQQLYCPGTIDHSHHLTFEIGTSTTSSSPYVPLNYSLIEHKEIFKKIETENIDEILEFLNKYDESLWPYANFKLNTFEWIAEEQPSTHIQVQYQTTCQYSSSLLVDLVPWCLVLNTIGLPVAIIIDGKQFCHIRHYGVVTPPKLDNTFNIGLKLKEKMHVSPLLQLARADWSQSFYMPKINGVIPLEGNIKVPVECGSMICMMSISSNLQNELRILQISSSYIITNHTNLNLQIICIAIPDNNVICNLSEEVMREYFVLESVGTESNVGVPINSWYCIDDNSDSLSDYSLHIIIATNFSQSYPIQVGVEENFRKNVCLYSDSVNIPLILIGQEYKGLTYLSIHHDIHPQLLIKNRSSKNFYFAQSDVEGFPVPENYCINWKNCIQPGTEYYYTMPSVSHRFPSIDVSGAEKLILAVDPVDATESYQWSQQININIFNEQYVRIPLFGDIKLSAEKLPHTILITLDSIAEVEINAQDIRSRLSLHSSQYTAHLSNAEYDSSSLTLSSLNENKIRAKNDCSIKSINERIAPSAPYDDCESGTYSMTKQFKSLENLLKNYSVLKNKKWELINLSVVLKTVIFTLTTDDTMNGFNQKDIMTLTCDFVVLSLEKNNIMNCCLRVANIQIDNRMFHRGCFDFPVVILGKYFIPCNISLNPTSIKKFIEEIQYDCDISINLRLNIWADQTTLTNITEIQDIQVTLGPLLIYIEDVFITKLVEYFNDLLPTNLVIWSTHNKIKIKNTNIHLVEIPVHLPWEAKILAKPLNLHSLVIDQISLLISVHSSVKLYIALDRSPLQFSRFERKHITTTSYQLGHVLTMHYLSGAIFGAGWVVGSLELLGSPGGLARTVGSGLKDFISLPYHGLIQGPWAFLVGITHGSASLMRHITAGTLDSVTKLASSVARNLDRLTLDEEHQRRTEEFRRQKPQGIAEGFLQGLTGLGISLLGAVGGIAHHSLQSVVNGGATPTNLVAGVGLGIVGVITKPLSGAAELVALTGQGILQGAGWNPLPTPRLQPITEYTCSLENCTLKYRWKLLQNFTLHTNIIATAEVSLNSIDVILLINLDAIIIINNNEDIIEKVINFSEISSIEESFSNFREIKICLTQPNSVPQNPETYNNEMDQACRERVADFVRNTSTLLKLSPSSAGIKLSSLSPILPPTQPSVIFYVVPQLRNYLCDILKFVKRQNDNNTFKIL